MSSVLLHTVAEESHWWLAMLLANSLLAIAIAAPTIMAVVLAPRSGPRLRHALWLLVLIRLVLPPRPLCPAASAP